MSEKSDRKAELERKKAWLAQIRADKLRKKREVKIVLNIPSNMLLICGYWSIHLISIEFAISILSMVTPERNANWGFMWTDNWFLHHVICRHQYIQIYAMRFLHYSICPN